MAGGLLPRLLLSRVCRLWGSPRHETRFQLPAAAAQLSTARPTHRSLHTPPLPYWHSSTHLYLFFVRGVVIRQRGHQGVASRAHVHWFVARGTLRYRSRVSSHAKMFFETITRVKRGDRFYKGSLWLRFAIRRPSRESKYPSRIIWVKWVKLDVRHGLESRSQLARRAVRAAVLDSRWRLVGSFSHTLDPT